MRHAVVTVLFVLVVFTVSPRDSVGCGVLHAEGSVSADLDEVREKIELLWSGSREERLEIAHNVAPHFVPLATAPTPEARETAIEVIKALSQYVSAEKDDWVTSRLLRGLAFFDNELLHPLFRDALDHPSPNVRWAALWHFVAHADPAAVAAVERLWSDEARPWIRVDLTLALTCQGSGIHVDDLLDFAESENPVLQQAATLSLSAIRPDGALERIRRLATSATPESRSLALQSLAAWPVSDATRELLLRAIHAEPAEVRAAAVRGLSRYESPEVHDLLLELALREEASRVRYAALTALSAAPAAAALDALVRAEPFLVDEQERAVAAGVREFLKRQRPRLEPGGTESHPGCRARPLGADPTAPPTLWVRASDPLETVRCWRGPGIAGDPLAFPRVRGGTAVEPLDLFETREGIWRLVRSQRLLGRCWLPEQVLSETAAGTDAALPEGHDRKSQRTEFDLPAVELAESAAEGLVAAGLLEIIDPGAELVAVVIDTEAITDAEIDRLIAAFEYGESVLDFRLAALLHGLRSRFPEHEGLRGLFQRIGQTGPHRVQRLIVYR